MNANSPPDTSAGVPTPPDTRCQISERICRLIRSERSELVWNMLIAVLVLTAALVLPYRLVAARMRFDGLYWLVIAACAMDVAVRLRTRMAGAGDRAAAARPGAGARRTTWLIADIMAALPLAVVIPATLRLQGVLYLLPLLKLLNLSATIHPFKRILDLPPALFRLAAFLFWFALFTHAAALGWLILDAAEPGRPFADQYLRAIYWCVTTITTIGYGDYGPDLESNPQILYTIAVQLTGVGMFTYVIGNMATHIANLDTARAEFRARVEEVCNTLRIQKLPSPIQDRVKRYYDYLWETRKGLSNDRFLRDLPDALRLDIVMHLNRAMLDKVPFFREAEEEFIRAVVATLEPLIFLPDDWLIRQGEFGDCMYLLARGEVEVLVDGNRIARLKEGSVLGETALLQGERRNASVRALDFCDVYRLSKQGFDALRQAYPAFDAEMRAVMRDRLRSTCASACDGC